MTTNRESNWLITGASQGFGRCLVEDALRRGDAVTAVVRDGVSVHDLVAAHPGRLDVIEADLRDERAVDRVADRIARSRIDVLVNNVGRAISGSAEDLGMAQLREQLELNFFAAAALTRAALPGMRHRRTGTIVQMSSQGGRLSFPGVGAYSASKFALEGWSEGLAAEVAEFGIRVLLIEPSRFRTGFNTAHSLEVAAPSDAYAGTVGVVQNGLASADGEQEGDPVRAARIIGDVVRSERVPLRLPLGSEAVDRLLRAYTAAIDGVREWGDIAGSADFPSEGA
ncbi:Fatty acyl-CoA reductase (plasmid) [Tsukamurella tyrosinosolvens]|uniref:Short-chain dehydrogenase n=1 Tax=Tsukamurella tyrosinosolvens TaxID=57704 RepID=A0A1H4PVY1_TSUTY|nr:SDR family NAD(P)-dependent oxidoreductase [Tsukamurella tyrosinosolvens]KXO97462.1 3-ketoacyl-ACP reductase [Tsukamurella tyrosinosolvens]SEC11424.1 Short-chain dehydrogenase [Tsukamurella tyrosinosolvens]VEH96856.1 Fatty acyl-CoA reductase [Tsukamurella tyrosinosolvens]